MAENQNNFNNNQKKSTNKANTKTNEKGKKSVVGVVAVMLLLVALITGCYISYLNGWLDPIIDKISPSTSITSEGFNTPSENLISKMPTLSAETSDIPIVDPAETSAISPVSIEETVVSVPELGDFNRPDEMKATVVTPGVDFYTNAAATEEELEKEVTTMLSDLKEKSFNTMILNVNTPTHELYTSARYPDGNSGSLLNTLISKAKEEDIYVYAQYSLNPATDEKEAEEINSALLNAVQEDVSTLAKNYAFDGILFSEYENNATSLSYNEYISLGNGMGYRNYMLSRSKALYETAATAVHDTNENMQAGLLVEQVWANGDQNTQGSETKSTYQEFFDGYVDTKALASSGLADFIMVNTNTTTTSTEIPFNTVAAWWGNVAQSTNIPMYVIYPTDKLGTKEEGWKDSNQLSEQIELAKAAPNYGGSVFDSLKAVQSDKSGSADAAIKTLSSDKTEVTSSEETVKETYVAKELTVNNPEKTDFTTAEPTINIRGAADPNSSATINGTALPLDANGYFSYKASLKAGKNTFTLTQNDKSVVLNITRTVKVIQSVAPTGAISAEGGTQMTVTAYVYEGSTVTAYVGGTALPVMEKDTTADDSVEGDSQYVRYVGTFTVPAATASAQNLGAVSVKATYEGASESATGGTVTVNKKVQEVAASVPAEGGKISGKVVSVVSNNAETFSIKTSDDVSSSDCYPLPKGAVDRIVSDKLSYTENGKTYEYYVLASGNRVYANSISSTGADSLDSNAVTGMTIRNDGRYTYVILANTGKPSYKMTKSGGKVSIALSDTSSVCDGLPSLTKTPLFSSATWSGSTLNLGIKNEFKGFYPYYEGNNLVLRFRNPVSAGNAIVVLDPGHSDNDPGAPGFFAGMDERELNRAVTNKTASILQNSGVRVLVVPTSGTTSLQSRVDYASSNGADLFISIHHNSSPNASATGTEVYYFNDASKSLASNVASGISSSAGMTNRGARYSYYYVTRHQMFPAILAECGFVTSQSEYNRLIQDSTQTAIASGIASGAISYLNSGYASSETGDQSAGGGSAATTNGAEGDTSVADGTTTTPEQPSTQAEASSPGESSSDGIVDVTPVPWTDD